MGKSRGQLRVALIQIRDHEGAAEQERQCFLTRCRLRPEQMPVHNVIHQPEIHWRHVENADALMIGGAGAHSVTETHPFTAPLFDVVSRAVEEDRPLFGSCWGHQFLAQVLGGTVETDEINKEVGTYPIRVTPEGKRDPLLAELPEEFTVQLGHKDRIDRAPPGIRVLATSPCCPHQVIRLADRPIYGSQFHSEMNDEDMRRRLRMYEDTYLAPDEKQAFEAGLRPSPIADQLLDRFLTLYT